MVGKKFTDVLDGDAIVDIMLDVEKGVIKNFVINLRLVVGSRIYEVYRCDTAHDFLHEQKFWRSSKLKRLKGDYNTVFNEKRKEISKKYRKYINWFKEAKGI